MRKRLGYPLILVALSIVLSINAYGQSRAYVTNQGNNTLEVIDLATNTVVQAIPVGIVPAEVAVSPDGTRVYVTNAGTASNSVSVIDAFSMTVIATVPVGNGPVGIAITPDGSRVYVGNDRSQSVSVINTATNTVIATRPVVGQAEGVAITPDGTRAYVTTLFGNSVTVIDTATNNITATIPFPTYPPYAQILPSGIDITPDGSLAVVTSLRGASVTFINTATNTIITTITIGGFNARDVDISPDGRFAYVAVEGLGSVKVIDLTTLSVVSTIYAGTSTWNIAVSQDGSRAYVTNYNSPLVIIDTASRTVIGSIPSVSSRAGIALWEAPPSDSTPPEIAASVTGTLGSNDWYISNIDVNWSVTDGESAVSSSSGCDASTVTTDTTGTTFTCAATSGGGTATQSVTIKRDAMAPAISCGLADGTWHSADVSIACNNSDVTSGLASAGDANFSLSTAVVTGTETANAATGSRIICDNAGNCSTAGSIVGNKVDKKAPVISITSPTAGSYMLNQAVTVSYSCSDGGSGIANCNGIAANGASLDTGSVGAKIFSVASADNVGNTTSPVTVNYTVGYGVIALYDQTRAHKSGSTIPIKIQLVDANGVNVSSPGTVVHAISVIQVSSQASTELGDAGNSNPDFDFRYDASMGGYMFNLQTTGFGTGSYRLNLTAGGSPMVYSVGFQVRR